MPALPAGNAEPVATAPAASLAVSPPPRPNLFDLYADANKPEPARAVRPESEDARVEPAAPSTPEATASAEAAVAPEPPMKKEAPPIEAVEPADEPAQPAADADKPAAEPEQPAPEAKEPAAESSDPQPEEPAAEPAAEDAARGSAGETAEATSRSVPDEPQRLWTDASGTHQALGWLVEVDTDRVRILKTSGRHATVAIDTLSAADRDYVGDVAARLVADQTHEAPGVAATAGL
jgi:hypothetical protein